MFDEVLLSIQELVVRLSYSDTSHVEDLTRVKQGLTEMVTFLGMLNYIRIILKLIMIVMQVIRSTHR